MKLRPRLLVGSIALLIALVSLAGCAQDQAAPDEDEFVSIFNGTDLTGWGGAEYVVEDGVLVCPAEGGGTLLTDREYANFICRFEFKLQAGGNNGFAIRTPPGVNPAYGGMELQILDNEADMYKELRPEQYHGSIYDCVASKRGFLKPVGEWNQQEVLVDGTHVRVTLNGEVILDADTADITDPEKRKAHPGLDRIAGRIGFMGHGDRLEFRNLRVKELPGPNTPPEGFVALFNGYDLTGWKGLVESPPARAAMTPEELAEKQAAADQRMRDHWRVDDGALVFDGGGDSLCTAKDYGDFEMLVDWKILPEGDSGIYLRGSPQVQIWQREEGSGALYNNEKPENPRTPLVNADKPVGEWNTFRIIMKGEKVTVYLNDVLVVDNVTMENYWERDKPIYPTGQIELQNHGNTLWFRNVFIREITE